MQETTERVDEEVTEVFEQETSQEEEMPAWKVEALHDLEHTTLSYQQIAKKVGRSRDTIIKLRSQHCIERPGVPRGGPTGIRYRPVPSLYHKAAGVRMTMFRNGRTFAEIADQLKISVSLLKWMELGIHDFTLTELIAISEMMGKSIDEIVEPFKITGDPNKEKG